MSHTTISTTSSQIDNVFSTGISGHGDSSAIFSRRSRLISCTSLEKLVAQNFEFVHFKSIDRLLSIGYLGPAQTLSVYRVGKFARLLELQQLLELLFSCSLKQSLQRRTLFKLHGNSLVKNVLRLAKLIMAILMIAYLTGSVYFFIANQVCFCCTILYHH